MVFSSTSRSATVDNGGSNTNSAPLSPKKGKVKNRMKSIRNSLFKKSNMAKQLSKRSCSDSVSYAESIGSKPAQFLAKPQGNVSDISESSSGISEDDASLLSDDGLEDIDDDEEGENRRQNDDGDDDDDDEDEDKDMSLKDNDQVDDYDEEQMLGDDENDGARPTNRAQTSKKRTTNNNMSTSGHQKKTSAAAATDAIPKNSRRSVKSAMSKRDSNPNSPHAAIPKASQKSAKSAAPTKSTKLTQNTKSPKSATVRKRRKLKTGDIPESDAMHSSFDDLPTIKKPPSSQSLQDTRPADTAANVKSVRKAPNKDSASTETPATIGPNGGPAKRIVKKKKKKPPAANKKTTTTSAAGADNIFGSPKPTGLKKKKKKPKQKNQTIKQGLSPTMLDDDDAPEPSQSNHDDGDDYEDDFEDDLRLSAHSLMMSNHGDPHQSLQQKRSKDPEDSTRSRSRTSAMIQNQSSSMRSLEPEGKSMRSTRNTTMTTQGSARSLLGALEPEEDHDVRSHSSKASARRRKKKQTNSNQAGAPHATPKGSKRRPRPGSDAANMALRTKESEDEWEIDIPDDDDDDDNNNDGINAEVIALKKKLKQATAKIDSMTETQRQERAQLSRTTTELTQIKMDYHRVSNESRDIKADMEEYEEALQEKDRLILKLSEAMDVQLDKVDGLEAKLERAEEEFMKMEDEMKEMEEELLALREEDDDDDETDSRDDALLSPLVDDGYDMTDEHDHEAVNSEEEGDSYHSGRRPRFSRQQPKNMDQSLEGSDRGSFISRTSSADDGIGSNDGTATMASTTNTSVLQEVADDMHRRLAEDRKRRDTGKNQTDLHKRLQEVAEREALLTEREDALREREMDLARKFNPNDYVPRSASSKELIDLQEQRLETWERDLDTLERRLTEQQERLLEQECQLLEKSRNIDAIVQSNRNDIERIETLEGELAMLQDDNEELRMELRAAKEAAKHSMNGGIVGTDRHNMNNFSNGFSNGDTHDLEDQVAELKKVNAVLTEREQRLCKKVEEYEISIQDMNVKLNVLERSNEEYRQLDEMRRLDDGQRELHERAAQEQRDLALRSLQEGMNKQLAELDNTNRELVAKVEQLTKEKQELQGTVKNLKERTRSDSETNAALKEKDFAIAELQIEIADLQEKILEKEKAVQGKRDEYDLCFYEIDELTQQKRELEGYNRHLQEQLKDEKADSDGKLKKKEETIIFLQSEMVRLAKEKQSIEAQLRQVQVDGASAQLKEMEMKMTASTEAEEFARIHAFNKQLKEFDDANRAMQEKLQQEQDANAEKIREKEDRIAQLQEELVQARKGLKAQNSTDFVDLLNDLKDRKSELEAAKRELQVAERKSQQLEDELEDIRTERLDSDLMASFANLQFGDDENNGESNHEQGYMASLKKQLKSLREYNKTLERKAASESKEAEATIKKRDDRISRLEFELNHLKEQITSYKEANLELEQQQQQLRNSQIDKSPWSLVQQSAAGLLKVGGLGDQNKNDNNSKIDTIDVTDPDAALSSSKHGAISKSSLWSKISSPLTPARTKNYNGANIASL